MVKFDNKWDGITHRWEAENTEIQLCRVGIYFYLSGISSRAIEVKLSAYGELEITALNKMYLQDGLLDVQILGCGIAWY